MVYQETRSRRWTTKTRNGCRTCRTRRIKCDETRPQCNKCVQSRRHCEGYELALRNVSTASLRILLPRATSHYGHTLSYAPLRHSSQGLDLQELQTLDFFRNHAANSLSGHFSSSVFQHLVLQVGEKQPVVLQASIAVGSIYRARLMATQMSFATIHDCPLYHSAVKQYNKSMSSLSQYIGLSDERDHAERLIVVLVTCLLFVCFEMLHGDQAIVLSHLVKGLKILFERTKIRDSACAGKRILTIGNSDQDTIDTISQVFVRLDADSTMFGRRAPYLCPRSFGRFLGPELDLPAAFASLEEARAHLDTLTSITFGFRGELLKLAEQDITPSDPESIDWPRHYCMLHAAVRQMDLDTNMELAMKKDKLLAAFKSWSDALDRLDAGDRRKALLMLRIQKFYPWFIITTLQDTRASLVDRFRDTFKSLLDMVSEYIDLTFHQCPEFAFALEPGITASVYLVGIQCRDQSIRKRAIEILGKSSIQEGLWSRRQFASYCQRFMELEERRAKEVLGLDSPDGHIPEQARFTDVVFGMDSSSPGIGRLICARNAVEQDDGLEIFEDRFEIDM